VLVVTRFAVPEADGDGFADQARAALGALAARPGYRRGHLGRAVDDPTSWLLLTEWDGVGAYRRALSGYDVRVTAVPLLALGQPEPGAFEVLSTVDHAGADLGGRSDRAADAGSTGPGAAPPAHLGPPPGPAQPPMPESAPLDLPGADRASAQAPAPPRSAHRTGQERP
jgi:heme oxygenase (mycobilin-producing)